jgi:hypothetical protein
MDAQARRDVDAFVELMVERGWVRPVDGWKRPETGPYKLLFLPSADEFISVAEPFFRSSELTPALFYLQALASGVAIRRSL